MVVSLMVRVMAVSSGSRSWFGFQVGLRFAGASGFEEPGEGRWLRGLPAAELAGHDGVLGTAWWPAIGEAGEGKVIGVVQLAHVLGLRPLGRDKGTVGLAAGSGFVRCPALDGHWPASLPAAVWGWLRVGYAVPGAGRRPAAAREASAAQSIWVARWP